MRSLLAGALQRKIPRNRQTAWAFRSFGWLGCMKLGPWLDEDSLSPALEAVHIPNDLRNRPNVILA